MTAWVLDMWVPLSFGFVLGAVFALLCVWSRYGEQLQAATATLLDSRQRRQLLLEWGQLEVGDRFKSKATWHEIDQIKVRERTQRYAAPQDDEVFVLTTQGEMMQHTLDKVFVVQRIVDQPIQGALSHPETPLALSHEDLFDSDAEREDLTSREAEHDIWK